MADPKAVWAYRQKTGVFVRKYNSVSEAARKINSHPSNILHAVRDGIAVKGYYWLVANGKRPLKVPLKSERFNPRSKPINFPFLKIFIGLLLGLNLSDFRGTFKCTYYQAVM